MSLRLAGRLHREAVCDALVRLRDAIDDRLPRPAEGAAVPELAKVGDVHAILNALGQVYNIIPRLSAKAPAEDSHTRLGSSLQRGLQAEEELCVQTLHCLARAARASCPGCGFPVEQPWLAHMVTTQVVFVAICEWCSDPADSLAVDKSSNEGAPIEALPMCKVDGVQAVAAEMLPAAERCCALLRDSLLQLGRTKGDATSGSFLYSYSQGLLSAGHALATLSFWLERWQAPVGGQQARQARARRLVDVFQTGVKMHLSLTVIESEAALDALTDCRQIPMRIPAVLLALHGDGSCGKPLAALLDCCANILRHASRQRTVLRIVSPAISTVLWMVTQTCHLALAGTPQWELAQLQALLDAWQPYVGQLPGTLHSMFGMDDMQAVVAKLQAACQELQADAQAEADAAMRALLAEEAGAAEAAAAKKAKKARRKARQQARKGGGAGKEEAGEGAGEGPPLCDTAVAGSSHDAGSQEAGRQEAGSSSQPSSAASVDSLAAVLSSVALEQQPAGSQQPNTAEAGGTPSSIPMPASDGGAAAAPGPAAPAGAPALLHRPVRAEEERQQAAAAARQRAELAELCTCPITHEPLEDPVIAPDGFTYERAAIEEWVRRRGVSPVTDALLALTDLQPNLLVRQLLRARLLQA